MRLERFFSIRGWEFVIWSSLGISTQTSFEVFDNYKNLPYSFWSLSCRVRVGNGNYAFTVVPFYKIDCPYHLNYIYSFFLKPKYTQSLNTSQDNQFEANVATKADYLRGGFVGVTIWLWKPVTVAFILLSYWFQHTLNMSRWECSPLKLHFNQFLIEASDIQLWPLPLH